MHVFFFVNFCVIFGSCQFIQPPSNTAVIVGQRLEMVCQAEINYTVREWAFQKPFKSASQRIYSNWSQPKIDNSNRFGYEIEDNSSVILYLNSTEMDDAGTYNCSSQQGSKQLGHRNAQLIVFETEPVCEDVMTTAYNDTLEEGSIVWMRCSLNFSGSVAPTMEWRQHGGDGEMDGRLMTHMVETLLNPDTNIRSTLTMVVNSSYNATFYSCKTYFQWNKTSSQNSATNSPDYSYTWNSSVLIISPTNLAEDETTTLFTSPSGSTSTQNGSPSLFSAFNAIYLVAGVAVLFGIASSLVAVILCCYLRRKNSATMALKNETEAKQSEYDLIPYAITDGYDTIEEVKEEDDILPIPFAPRLGPLPSPGYSALMPEAPKPPGVYSRMDDKKKSVDEYENEAGQNRQQTSPYDLKPDQPELRNVEDSTRKTALHISSYLQLETEPITDDIGTADEEIPSAYLKITEADDILTEVEEIPSAYLKVTDESLPSNLDNKVSETNQEDNYGRKAENDYAEDREEIPSDYLRITDDTIQSSINNNVFKDSEEYQIPSSYLTTRQIDS